MEKIIALLLAIVLLIPAMVLGGNIAFREIEGVDMISSLIYGANLAGNVEEDTICNDPITHEDKEKAMTKVNQSVYNMIIYQNEKFFIDLKGETNNSTPRTAVSLNGKDVAALAEIIIEQENVGQIKIAEGMYINASIKDVDFESIDNSSVRVKAVLAVDVTELKAEMEIAAKNAIANAEQAMSELGVSGNEMVESALTVIPDTLYIASEFILNDNGEFSYEIEHESMAINKLSCEEVDVLFTTIDYFSKIGNAEEINEIIAYALADALIGRAEDEKTGFAEAFFNLGATSYEFREVSGKTYFIIKM